jgi:hypothetical protein
MLILIASDLYETVTTKDPPENIGAIPVVTTSEEDKGPEHIISVAPDDPSPNEKNVKVLLPPVEV